ncbi:MAG: hypothetical protein NT126_05200 [Bacteroidetes bacterium]|nr:hypothetical protein [Bacteroidota bacterium]
MSGIQGSCWNETRQASRACIDDFFYSQDEQSNNKDGFFLEAIVYGFNRTLFPLSVASRVVMASLRSP